MSEQIVLIIGNNSVGKTFIGKYLTLPQGKFDFNRIRVVPTIVTKHVGQNYRIHECGGSYVVNAIRPTMYKKANLSIIMIVFSLVDKESFYSVTSKYIPEIKKSFVKGGGKMPPIFLVGSKNDLTSKKTFVHQDTIINCVKRNNLCCYLNVSSKDGTNMESLKTVMREFWVNKPKGGIPPPSEEEEDPKKQVGTKKGPLSKRVSEKKLRKTSIPQMKKNKSTPQLKKVKSRKKVAALEKKKKKKMSKRLKKGPEVKIDRSFKLEKNAPQVHGIIFADDIETIKSMIESGVSMMTTTKHMNTPLHYAAAGNHIYIVQMLVKLPEVNGDVYNVDGETPLTLAAQRGHSFVVQSLIETGKCNIRLPQKKGEKKFPLALAIDDDTRKVFLAQKDREREFLESVKKNDFTSFKNYVKFVDINCIDDNGKTAIEHALDSVGTEDILESMCFRGVNITTNMWKGHMFYESEMKRYWHKRKREIVIYEILKDEKTYTDKLDPIIDLFVKPVVPKLLKLLAGGKRGKMGDKNKEYLMMVTQMLNALSTIHLNHRDLLRELMNRTSYVNPPKQQKIATAIREMQLENYLKFVKSYLPLSELVKREKELEKFRLWIETQERKTGLLFWKTLKEPNMRLHKYKSYLTRLVSNCLDEVNEDKILKVIFQASLDGYLTHIEKIESVTQELKGKNMIISISATMKEKFNYTSLMENPERSYVFHGMDVPVRFFYETEEEERKRKVKKGVAPPKFLDVFFFNDMVFVGDPLSRTLISNDFVKEKMVLDINHSSITLAFFSEHRVKPDREYIFDTPVPKKWSQPLKRAYLNNPDYYSSTVLILDHLKDIEVRSRFHELPVKLRNVDRIKIREGEISHLEDQIKVYNEDIQTLKRRIQSYKDEAIQIQKLEDRKKKEREERKKKMMEMVKVQKEIQKQQLSKQKEEEEYVRKMREEQEKLMATTKGKKKRGKFGFGKRRKRGKSAVSSSEYPSKIGGGMGGSNVLKGLGGSNDLEDLIGGIMGGDDEENEGEEEEDQPVDRRAGGGLLSGLLGDDDDIGGFGGGGDSRDRGGGGLDRLLGLGINDLQSNKNTLGVPMKFGGRKRSKSDIGSPQKKKIDISNRNKEPPSAIKKSRFDDIMAFDDSVGGMSNTPSSPLLMNWESSFTKEADEAALKLEELERELAALED